MIARDGHLRQLNRIGDCDALLGGDGRSGSVDRSTLGPAGMGPKYFVSRAFNSAGLKSPAMAMDALLGV